MQIYKSFIAVLLLGISAMGYSQQVDSLMNYLEIAAKKNPSVQQKFTEYQAALQKVPQAGSLSDPELNLGLFLSPMELVGGKQLAEIQLMQMFPWFGVLKNAKDEMSLMAKAKYESFRDAKLQLYFDLQQTWYTLYKVNQSVRSSEKNLEILRTLERLSLVRFKAASSAGGPAGPSSGSMQPGTSVGASPGSSGMQSMGGSQGSGSNSRQVAANPNPPMQSSPMASASSSGLADLYRIQIEIGELENGISLLHNQQNTITARFNSFLDRPIQMPVAIPDTLFADTLNIALESVSDSMLQNHPMLGMLNFEKQSLEARKQMVTRMGYPMVGLGVNYSLINKNEMSEAEMNGTDMIMPMVRVTLPIYRKKYKAMQAEAELQRTATDQAYQATVNSLETEYSEAVQNFQDAKRRISLYTRQNQLTGQSLRILMKSFSASGAGLTDLLLIRQQRLDYELKQVEAVADFNTAIAQLKRLMAQSNNQ